LFFRQCQDVFCGLLELFQFMIIDVRPLALGEAKAQAHYVTSAPGGSGAVREVVELILKAQGYWEEILKKYEVRAE
jgi:3-deoxy-D-manno-octulosonate 8-phosphate phosphatase KdsC-like HAD superfamily phosphatase